MAKNKPAKKALSAQPESIAIAYDLFDLPTAQHKAGLAGMILQIRSMSERKLPPEQIPVIEQLAPTSAVIRFSESSLQRMFDDLYDAAVVEVAVKTKWGTEKPIRVEEAEEEDPDTHKVRTIKRFVYEVVQPCGHFLMQHFPDADGLWLKLWRDMLWNIPRGRPTTRRPYQQRANRELCSEGAEAWRELSAFQKAVARKEVRTCEVASALLLGAQALNAESVPFRGRTDQTLVLHFWPLVAMIFVPQVLDGDGTSEFVGYTLAIPEVADLTEFCRLYPRVLSQLSADARGYRPAGAVIDIPQQAGLEFLENLARLSESAAGRKETTQAVASVEYMHMVKAGNNVKSVAAGRIAPNPRLLDEYLECLCGSRPRFRNPLFRAGLMRWMLDEAESAGRSTWYRHMARMMAERPWPFFVRCDKTPKSVPWFAADAKNQFQDRVKEYQDEWEASPMTDVQPPAVATGKPQPPLEVLVYRLVQNFVRKKTKDKCDLEWDDFKDKKSVDPKTNKERVEVPAAYAEAKERVVSDAFLAMRSRREKDFVEYFTASICSVRRFLSEDDFCVVAKALLEQPEDVKTLTLLALSANS